MDETVISNDIPKVANIDNECVSVTVEDDGFTKVEQDDQSTITSHAFDMSESSTEDHVLLKTHSTFPSSLVETSNVSVTNALQHTLLSDVPVTETGIQNEQKASAKGDFHDVAEEEEKHVSRENLQQDDNRSKSSVYSSNNSCHSSDSRSFDGSESYDSGSSYEVDRGSTTTKRQAAFTQPAIFNRFSAWRKQAATTIQQTATTISTAKVSTNSFLQTKATSAPLQVASLSPATTPTNDIAQVTTITDTDSNTINATGEETPSLVIDTLNGEDGKLVGPVIDNIEIKPSSAHDPWTDLSEFERKKSNVSSAFRFGSSSQHLRPQIDVLSRAAANVVDSVQSSYFRGRYTTSNNPSMNQVDQRSAASVDSDSQSPNQRQRTFSNASNSNSQTNAPLQTSQTARIMASPSAVHMQEIVESLQPNEVVMLLGRGRLGVNLKQTYKKNTGVFVDFFVEGGAAHAAAVASVGDILKQIGADDTQINGTILSVPAQIAKASRPVQLIFRSGTTDPANVSKINFVDVAVALMHELLQQNHDMEQLVDDTCTTSLDAYTAQCVLPSFEAIDSLAHPPGPPSSVQKSYATAIVKRNMLPVATSSQGESHDLVVKEICQLTATHPNTFRIVQQGAFLLCCVDSRRVQYLKNQFSGNSIPVVSSDAYSYVIMPRQQSYENPKEDCRLDTMMLEMFLELQDFVDYFDITPHRRRHEIALRIGQKYILPTKVVVNGLTTLTPPAMDLHSSLVSDAELRKLESVLLTPKDDNVQHDVPRDLFWDFQRACFQQLACGSAFAKFMISAECSRMRAYLRNTAPFVNVPLTLVMKEISCHETKIKNIHALNYVQYCVLFLLAMTDREIYGENDAILDQTMKTSLHGSNSPANSRATPSDRIEDAANGFCAAVFIQSKLLPACKKALDIVSDNASNQNPVDTAILERMIQLFELLWENFVSPNVGALAATAASSPNEEDIIDALLVCRSALNQVTLAISSSGGDSRSTYAVAKQLLNDEVINSCKELADELLYDYATNLHSKFRMHKFHEWLCEEVLIATHYKAKGQDDISKMNFTSVPEFPHGCIKRLLRKADFPSGISVHKPSNTKPVMETSKGEISSNLNQVSAECAVVFGTSVGTDCVAPVCGGLNQGHGDVRRYACSAVAITDESSMVDSGSLLQPSEIPTTFESYSIVPRTPEKPFGKYGNCSNVSADGWKVSIVNFVIPRADSKGPSVDGDSWLYGVSMMFQKQLKPDPDRSRHNSTENPSTFELLSDPDLDKSESFVTQVEKSQHDGGDTTTIKQIKVSKQCPLFNSRLNKENWIQRVSSPGHGSTSVLIGVSLVSQQNVIFSMRNALSMLLRSFSTYPSLDCGIDRLHCGPLIDVLGTFSNPEVESDAIKYLLEPYLRKSASPWLHLPISAQRDLFIENAGEQLIRCLPPIPLALMFVTVLLEQKIVISSSRRSMLMSAISAITELLKPLKWCHLIVPQVPAALASDLLQYPAPSILGLCSDDPGTVDLVRNLNHDVTLVDLDVGRVILASSFAHDSELGRGTPNNAETARALRSQVLLLAQSLGSVFASQLDPYSWCCDSYSHDVRSTNVSHKFDKLKSLCRDFVNELLCGTSSCCYWVEEAVSDEYNSSVGRDPTVLFDEDRFFQIKNFRDRDAAFRPLFDGIHEHDSRNALALSLDNFDLVLELFLRCQGMNAYIGSRRPDEMFFAM